MLSFFQETTELLKNPEKHDDQETSANIKMTVALSLLVYWDLEVYDT